MKTFIAVLCLAAVANAGLIAAPLSTVIRTPSLDSAIIKSDRIGGNFAYSVAESHAHVAHQYVATPVAVTYAAASPAIARTVVAAAPALAPHWNLAAAPAIQLLK